MIKLSPTQIDKWRRCQRGYLFEYVDKIKTPPSPKQQFGTDVHAVLAAYLKHGIPLPNNMYGRVAQQAVKNVFLPEPGEDLIVEEPFVLALSTNIVLGGIPDCIMEGCNPIWLFDHKITSALKYAKTESTLVEDPQAIIYAATIMIQYDVRQVNARWIYYQATSPANGKREPSGCRKIDVSFRADDPLLLTRVDEIEKDIREIVKIRSLTTKINVLDFPSSPEACGMFGGCPHIERCNLSTQDKLEAAFSKF